MPDKTHGELIRELLTLGASLTAELKSVRSEVERLDARLTRLTEQVMALATQVALLQQQLSDFKKDSEEAGRRRWMVVGPIRGSAAGECPDGVALVHPSAVMACRPVPRMGLVSSAR